jgi:CelD/BcsL family acetyltransferase involved in cellulose biosynthesis
MSKVGKPATEEEVALYDAIERAIANVHAALAEIDAAWVGMTAERPSPSGRLRSPPSMLQMRFL